MSKNKSGKGKPSPQSAELARQQRARNLRETVESVAIAFILAFLFRTFEAEAFVIPTGSMAPTLQGQHKDVECPKCMHRCRFGASNQNREVRTQIVYGTCSMCGYRMWVGDRQPLDPAEQPLVAKSPSRGVYSGDRILVGKFSYEFGEPLRWDVVVFKFIGVSPTGDTSDASGLPNYIKRLVGLPGEVVTIRYGDIYTRPLDELDAAPEITRKPPEKQRAMMHLVHDNAFVPSELYAKKWPLRWQVWPPGATGGWTSEVDAPEGDNITQVFSNDGASADATWIRYQHFVASHEDWIRLKHQAEPDTANVRPQLITDFYTYNTSLTMAETTPAASRSTTQKLGIHWVGDLALETDVQISGSQGQVLLDLVEAGVHFRCSIDVASGEAVLTIPANPEFVRRADTDVRGPGSHRLTFSNVDDQLRLWVDGAAIVFDDATTFNVEQVFPAPNAMKPVYHSATDPGDLSPAGVGSKGAALQVTGLRLFRDIYYIATKETHGEASDYSRDPRFWNSPESRRETLSNPSRWQIFANRRSVDFPLAEDQFFVLGDNSPFSLDGRLWQSERGVPHYVERRHLIGRALCIYWPHSWNRIPGTPIPFPFFPNFADMGLVR